MPGCKIAYSRIIDRQIQNRLIDRMNATGSAPWALPDDQFGSMKPLVDLIEQLWRLSYIANEDVTNLPIRFDNESTIKTLTQHVLETLNRLYKDKVSSEEFKDSFEKAMMDKFLFRDDDPDVIKYNDLSNKDSVMLPNGVNSSLHALALKREELFNTIYAGNIEVNDIITSVFNSKLVEVLYFLLEGNHPHLVDSPSIDTFNKNMYRILEDLYATIVRFLKSKGELTADYSELLYVNGEWPTNVDPEEVLSKMHLFIHSLMRLNLHEQNISKGWSIELYADSNLGGNTSDPAYSYYKAVEAWYNLRYFDDALKSILGNTIQIKHSTNIIPKKLSIHKYTPAVDKSGRFVGFNMDDLRNGFSEAGRLSVAFLTALPIYSYLKKTKMPGRHIGHPNLALAISKLRKLVNNGAVSIIALDDNTKTNRRARFNNNVMTIHENPREILYEILSELFGKQTHGILDNLIKDSDAGIPLNDDDVNVLYSLWISVFATKGEGLDNVTSLTTLENQHRVYKFNHLNSYSVVDCIAGLVDRVCDVDYYNVDLYGEDGLNIKLRKKYNYSLDLMDLRDDTNTFFRDMVLSDRRSLLDRYTITKEGPNHRKVKLKDATGKTIVIEIKQQLTGDKEKDTRSAELLTSSTRNEITLYNEDGSILGNPELTKDATLRQKIKLASPDEIFGKVDWNNEQEVLNNKELVSLLDFIGSMINRDLTSKEGLHCLYLYKLNSNGHMLLDLLDGAIRMLINHDAIIKFSEQDSVSLFIEFLARNENFKDIYGNIISLMDGKIRPETGIIKKLMVELGENNFELLACHRGCNWYEGFAQALAVMNGGLLKATTKNFANKQELSGRTNFLANELPYYLRRARQKALEVKDINNKISDAVKILVDSNSDEKAKNAAISTLKKYCTLDEIDSIPNLVKANKLGEFVANLLGKLKRVALSRLSMVWRPNSYRLVILQTDLRTSDGSVINVKLMNPSELITNAIFFLFFGSLSNNDRGLSNSMLLQPTTYADKTTIPLFAYDSRSLFFAVKNDGSAVPITGCTYSNIPTTEKLIEVVKATIGAYYLDVAYNIIQDYQQIISNLISGRAGKRLYPKTNEYLLSIGGKLKSLDDLNTVFKFKELNDEALTTTASRLNINLYKDVHYIGSGSNLKVNELLYYYVNTLYNPNNDELRKRIEIERVNFVNSLLASNLYVNIKEDAYAPVINNNDFMTKEDRSLWISNNSLIIAKVKKDGKTIKDVILGINITLEPGEEIELNPLYNRYFNSYFAIAPLQRITLTGSEIAHPYTKCNATSVSLSANKNKALIGIYTALNKTRSKEDLINFSTGFDSWINFINAVNNSDIDENLKTIALDIYRKAMIGYEGIEGSEGAQLKRNVIIPATLLYVQQKAINSIPAQVRIAVMSDLKAFVNSFNGLATDEDSCDGSALINPFMSILENYGLQDLEVGWDKKPIWHIMDDTLGTAGLLKFAAYTITNNRMLQTINSSTKLETLFRRLNDVAWYKGGKWTNSKGSKIDLLNGRRYGYSKGKDFDVTLSFEENIKLLRSLKNKKEKKEYVIPSSTIDFSKDICNNKELRYGFGNSHYKITDLTTLPVLDEANPILDINGNNIYCTEEYLEKDTGYTDSHARYRLLLFDKFGRRHNIIYRKITSKKNFKDGVGVTTFQYIINPEQNDQIVLGNDEELRTYIKEQKLTTINSLYQLHKALGGIFCEEKTKDGTYISSEMNNFCIANYMNIVSSREQITDVSSDIAGRGITLDDYYQPLKEMMISYAANVSGYKVGAGNINNASVWTDDSINVELKTITVATAGLGILGDYDHEADDAMMSTPTLVMTALALGGKLFDKVDQIYRAVGRAAMNSILLEADIIRRFLKEPKKFGELYDLIGRIVIENFSSSTNGIDLGKEMIDFVKKNFGINLSLHEGDKNYLPISDSSIFSHLVPIIVNSFNRKAIKTKNPGSGMVMIPSYGMLLLYYFDGKEHTLADLLKRISLDKSIIETDDVRATLLNFLEEKQKEITLKTEAEFSFDLYDIINVIDANGNRHIINLSSIDKFYAFKHHNWYKFATKYGANASKIKQLEASFNTLKENDLFILTVNLLTGESIENLRFESFETLVLKYGLGKLFCLSEENILNLVENKLPIKLTNEHNIIKDLIDKKDIITLCGQDSTTLKYLENVTVAHDLKGKRITFFDVESNKRKSIYDIPIIEKAFEHPSKREGTLGPTLMNEIFKNLKEGFYYDYIYDKEADKYIADTSTKHQVTKVIVKKAQAIASNVHAAKFGGNWADSMDDLEKKLFIPARVTYTTEKNFDILLIKSNNIHTYISFRPNLNVKNYNKINFNELKVFNSRAFVYDVYELNDDFSKGIEVGKVIERTDLTIKDGKIYNNKDEISKEKHLKIVDGKILQTIIYVTKYTKADGETAYTIDTGLINKIVLYAKVPVNVLNLINSIVSTIYNKDSYLAVYANNVDDVIKKAVTSVVDDTNNLRDYIKSTTSKIFAENRDDRITSVNKFLTEEAKRILVSYQKAKEVVSSRIPSQSLLSFMGMELVGFSLMETNVAYVAAELTFLLGSDYDIDKAYMMSYFFDDNGRYITWSPIASINSVLELEASTLLAYPDKIYTVVVDNKNLASCLNKNLKEKERTFEGSYITDESLFEAIAKAEALVEEAKKDKKFDKEELNELKAKVIERYADLILYMYDERLEYSIAGVSSDAFVISADLYAKYKNIIDTANKHLFYEPPTAIAEQAILNSYTAKILIIISDLLNANAASTPISMSKAHEVTSRSLSTAASMTMLNPAAVYHMQQENQTGKHVISVAANGEKGFFTLYLYTSSVLKAIKNKLLKLKKELEQETDPIKLDMLRQLINDVFDYDGRFVNFRKKFDRVLNRWNYEETKQGLVTDVIKTHIANLNYDLTNLSDEDIDHEVDQMISLLLSAATDNAKELILKKINADSNFAKMYFYLLTLGFSLNDAAAFMTSGVANLIVQFADGNAFDSALKKRKPESSINMFVGGYLPLNDFIGEYWGKALRSSFKKVNISLFDENGNTFSFVTLGDYFKKRLTTKLYSVNPTTNPKATEVSTLLIIMYSYKASQGEDEVNPKQLPDHVVNDLKRFSIWVDNVSSRVRDTIKNRYNNNLEEYESDLNEFKSIWNGSTEFSTLVLTYLATNLGIPQTLSKFDALLDNITNSVINREKEIRVPKDTYTVNLLTAYKDIKGLDEKIAFLYDLFKNDILKNNKLASIQTPDGQDYLLEVITKVVENSLVGNFNVLKWLDNTNEYRQLVKEWYNLIKDTFNIFDVIDVHPSYKANFKVLPAANVMISKSNRKYLLRSTLREIYKNLNNGFWNSKNDNALNSIVNKILIRDFLALLNLTLDIDPTWNIIEHYKLKVGGSHGVLYISINDGNGYASFKYIMEKYIIPLILSGLLEVIDSKGNKVKINQNDFIKGLKKHDSYNVPSYKLDIKMSLKDNSAYNKIKYLAYLTGFKELSLYKVEGFTNDGNILTVLDLIVVYNFIVNLNMYGDDRLTTIFKTAISVENPNSLFTKYQLYEGAEDSKAYYSSKSETIARLYLKDLLIAIAPSTTVYGEKFHTEPYIRVRDHGLILLKELNKTTKEYNTVMLFEEDESEAFSLQELYKYYMQYGMLGSITLDEAFFNANMLGIDAKQEAAASIIYKALSNLVYNNRLFIYTHCK